MADVTVTAIRSLLVNVCVLLVLGGVSLSNGEPAPNKNVICYHHYKSPSYPGVTNYSIADIDPSICTHLVYFYTWVTPSPIETMNSDISHSPEWEKLKSLRLANPSLKIILSLYDYDHVLPTLTYEDRQTSVIFTKDYLRTYGFDGLEYLWYKDISQDLTVFLEEMHAVFAAESTSKYAEPLILMLTVMGSSSHIGEDVDVSRLAEAVDIFHVMSFGYSVSFASKTGLANPLHGTGTNYFDNNVSGSLSYFLDAGMTPEKLHMAVQLKAMTFTLSDPQLTGVGAPAAGKGDPGEHTKVDGKLSYYEVCKRLQQELYTAEMDPEGLVKFAYKGDQWMTYEDIASLKIKMDYVIEHNLGGVAVWFLHEDDYTGQFCNQGRYPLTSALYRLASQWIPHRLCITGSLHIRLQKFTRFETEKNGKLYSVPKCIDECFGTTGHWVFSFKWWKEFVNLRLANPSLKVILSLEDYADYSYANSHDHRQTFINNVVEFLRRWEFDGIDCWLRAVLSPPYVNLFEEMHAAFEAEATSSGRDPLILMVTASIYVPVFSESVDVQRLAGAIDIFHVQTYFLGLGFSLGQQQTGLSAPLYGNWSEGMSVSQKISSILDAGVPPEKVHMAIQLFAFTKALSDPVLTGVGAPTKGLGNKGEYTKQSYELSYYEICKRLQEEGYTAEFDPEGLVNFAYKGDQWMSYEDQASLEIKMSYVYENNLGGVAAWYLPFDDYTGQFCNQGRYPLLSTLYNYRPANTEMIC